MMMVSIQAQKANISMEKKIRDIIKTNRELTSRLLLVQEEERQKLAIDVHNNLGQSVTLLSMMIDRLRKLCPEEIGPFLDEIETQKMELVQQIRNLSNSLSMYMLKDVGLSQALREFFDRVHNSTSLKINYHCTGLKSRPDWIIEISIFRMIQETIANVLRHTNTDEVDISIEATNKTLNLSIGDKEAENISDSDQLSKVYLRDMKERAEILGAKFEVQSPNGKGITLIAKFPLSS